jgi:UDP-N-acetylmuramyl pentapeptide synthase
MDFFTRIIFHFKETKIIIVTGERKSYASETIAEVLSSHFKVKKFIEKTPNIIDSLTNEIFVIEADLKNQAIFKKLVKMVKYSKLPILVVSKIGESAFEKIYKFSQLIPPYGFLILDFDDKKSREIDSITNLKNFTFGFEEGADFKASDLHINTGVNFKINYKGKIIPIWQEKFLGQEYIYSALAASCVGIVLGLNFVEISETLKHLKISK